MSGGNRPQGGRPVVIRVKKDICKTPFWVKLGY